uniref:Uncharacterized protein n=1 Tax=Globodera rostochiensis TaxID=31243 RepID=A0A914ICZ8_GLORO
MGIRLILSVIFCIPLLFCAIWPRQECIDEIFFWREHHYTIESMRPPCVVTFIHWSLSTALIGCHYYIIFCGYNAIRKRLYKWTSRPSNLRS